MTERCEGCGREVRLAGGIANIWTTEQTRTEGMTLEFEDGTEHFLCFDCIEQLPDHPSTEDVEALDGEENRESGSERDRESDEESNEEREVGDGADD